MFNHRPNGASYTLTARAGTQLVFAGSGITNSTEVGHYFVAEAGGGFIFSNSAAADTDYSGTPFTIRGGTASNLTGGFVEFLDSSEASVYILKRFTNGGGTVPGASGGLIEFRDNASSATADYTNESGVVGAGGGVVNFFDNSIGNGSIINQGADAPGAGAGSVHLYGNSNVSCALFAHAGKNGGAGGLIEYNDDAAGQSGIYVYGDGLLDLAKHNPATPVTISFLQGDGLVSLGATNLRIGANVGHVFLLFSGTISDDGAGGSITIFGSNGVLFEGANTYTGGTTIDGGYLEVLYNGNGSGTGPGPVIVTAGILSGNGVIGGEVTLGDGRARRAVLSPYYGVGAFAELKI